MSTNFISATEETRMRNSTCAGKIIIIVAVAARMTPVDVLNNLNENTTLGDLGVTATRCEHIVRDGVNKTVRRPNGIPDYAPVGAIKQSKTVKSLIVESC